MSEYRTQLTVLDQVLIISFAETQLWTGKAKLTAEDLGLSEDSVPPDAVASLGSKRIIAAKDLKPLQNIRYKMRRACQEVGTKFMSGFAIPVEEGQILCRKLDELVKAGEELKKSFLSSLDSKLEDWHCTYPKWQHIMRAGSPERMRIANKIHFGYIPIMAGCPADSEVAKNLMGAVGMMGNTLVSEVVREASAFVKTSLTGARDSGNQRTVEPIRRLAQKIKGLRFLHPSFGCIHEVLFSVLKDIPTSGKVTGDDFLNLARVATLLADRNRLEATARRIYDGEATVGDVVEEITGIEMSVGVQVQSSAVSAVSIFDDDTAPTIGSIPSDLALEAVRAMRKLNGPAAAPAPAKSVEKQRVDF